jgi:hypothetical protein
MTPIPSSSSVLFVIGCSNAKAEGGDGYPADPATFPEALGGSWTTRLLEARATLYRLVAAGEVRRSGRLIQDLPYNRLLVWGQDLGGVAASPGEYLPARRRYTGRLYKGVSDGWLNRRHHVVIFSSLYGLLLPDEPIQRYSVHLGDDDQIRRVWGKDDLATSALAQYVHRRGIRLVISALGEDLYRDVFRWEVLADRKVRVLHVFGEQNAGPAALPAIGSWLRRAFGDYEETLLGFGASTFVETDVERLSVTESRFSPPGWPDESQLLVEQVQKYYAPLLNKAADVLASQFGAGRWEWLEGRGCSRDFLVSGFALWLLSRNVPGDFSPVCVQLAKAVETILNLEVVVPSAASLAGFDPHEKQNERYAELIRCCRGARSLSLGATACVLQNVRDRRGPEAVLRALASTPFARPPIQRLADVIGRLAAYRNPRAHTESAGVEVAASCVRLVFGNLDEAAGIESGLLCALLKSVQ